EQTPLKGLAASGWHTAAIAMRLAVEVRPFGPHPLLGLGVDELRWLAPVRPGDRLHSKARWSNSCRLRQNVRALLGSNGRLSTSTATPFTRLPPLPSCRAVRPDGVPTARCGGFSVDVGVILRNDHCSRGTAGLPPADVIEWSERARLGQLGFQHGRQI